MFNKTFVYTSIFSAIFMTLSLSFIHLFNFIKWSPVGWTKEWRFFSSAHYSIKWMVLLLALVIIFAVLYIVFSFLDAISPAVLAIVFGVIGIIALEWFISEPKTPIEVVKSISIPFIAITAIVLRFISGTAVFMRKITRKV